jgi:hypothetical protein
VGSGPTIVKAPARLVVSQFESGGLGGARFAGDHNRIVGGDGRDDRAAVYGVLMRATQPETLPPDSMERRRE